MTFECIQFTDLLGLSLSQPVLLALFVEVALCGWMGLGKLRDLCSCPSLPSMVYETAALSERCNVSAADSEDDATLASDEALRCGRLHRCEQQNRLGTQSGSQQLQLASQLLRKNH